MSKFVRVGLLAALVLAVGFGGVAGAHSFASGYYYAYGVVVPRDSGMYPDGTHLLKSPSGAVIALLSSTKYDLAQVEGDSVRVYGWTRHSSLGHWNYLKVSSLVVLGAPRARVYKTVIEQGNDSGWPVPAGGGNYVIRDAETWMKYYNLHGTSDEVPAVDFSRSMVLALFMGQQPTTGHAIRIDRIERSAYHTFVRYTNVHSGSPFALTTRPFLFVRVTKDPGAVYFNGKLQDDPWKEAQVTLTGHVTLGAGIDASKVKVGIFGQLDNATYVVWPALHPLGVTSLDADGTFTKTFASDLLGNSHLHLAAIVWEDLDGDGTVNGDAWAASRGYFYEYGAWHRDDDPPALQGSLQTSIPIGSVEVQDLGLGAGL